MLTKEQMSKLTTKRLLSYHKAERKRMIRFKNRHTCEDCGETDWDRNPDTEISLMLRRQHYNNLLNVQTIKEVLDTREHVKTN